MAAEDPKTIDDILIKHHCKFKLKGTSPIAVYLGIDFFCDEYRALYLTPRKHIEKICASIKHLIWPSSQTGCDIIHKEE